MSSMLSHSGLHTRHYRQTGTILDQVTNKNADSKYQLSITCNKEEQCRQPDQGLCWQTLQSYSRHRSCHNVKAVQWPKFGVFSANNYFWQIMSWKPLLQTLRRQTVHLYLSQFQTEGNTEKWTWMTFVLKLTPGYKGTAEFLASEKCQSVVAPLCMGTYREWQQFQQLGANHQCCSRPLATSIWPCKVLLLMGMSDPFWKGSYAIYMLW